MTLLPTSYSESVFADYLVSVLGEVATTLGWDAGTVQVLEAVNDTLLELGQTDITALTSTRDLRGLRALGRRAIWRAVVQNVATRYDFTDIGQQKFSRSQIQEMALAALKMADGDCLEFSPMYAATIVRIHRPQDPYAVLPDSERVP